MVCITNCPSMRCYISRYITSMVPRAVSSPALLKIRRKLKDTLLLCKAKKRKSRGSYGTAGELFVRSQLSCGRECGSGQ